MPTYEIRNQSRLLPLVTAVVALSLNSCAPGSTDSADDEEGVSSSEALAPITEGPSCADPGAMLDNGTIYVVCTGRGFPVYTATDPHGPFKLLRHVFPNSAAEPAWADKSQGSDWWAPELHHVGNQIVVYFTATEGNRHVIGAASTTDAAWAQNAATAPFQNQSKPLVADTGSKIDPHELSWKGRHFLYWKAELFDKNGNQADAIRAQELGSDGLSFLGAPPPSTDTHTVLAAKEPWEGGVVEAPWIFPVGDELYLFYSGNAFCNPTYGIGVARSKDPLGKFERETVGRDGIIVGSGKRWLGPGHNAVIWAGDGHVWSFFHAYDEKEGTPTCKKNQPHDNNIRHLLAAPVDISHGFPGIEVSL